MSHSAITRSAKLAAASQSRVARSETNPHDSPQPRTPTQNPHPIPPSMASRDGDVDVEDGTSPAKRARTAAFARVRVRRNGEVLHRSAVPAAFPYAAVSVTLRIQGRAVPADPAIDFTMDSSTCPMIHRISERPSLGPDN